MSTENMEDLSKRSEKYQIRVDKLVKSFSGQRIIKELSLDIERGKINVIIGGSGHGKSLTMKHLMGLIKPDSGRIFVDGVDIVKLSEYKLNTLRRKFGMVFQYAALFDSMNVYENIAFPLKEHTKKTKGEIKDIVSDMLESVSLPGIEKKLPSELSGGMKKRVGLARALVMKPEVLFYDEPTTGLDPIATRNIDELIALTNEKYGVTSIIISHDLASTFRIAHRIAMIFGGKIVEEGAPSSFIRTNHPDVIELLEVSGILKPGTNNI
jgi:phospholipid/cholesterol/gamma-HCH transport system ATP-binding protein